MLFGLAVGVLLESLNSEEHNNFDDVLTSMSKVAAARRVYVFSFFFHFTHDRKLRDEYDKLEGALRKLGVDPESVVGGGTGGGTGHDGGDEADEADYRGHSNVELLAGLDQGCYSRSGGGPRHLDILEEVSDTLQ